MAWLALPLGILLVLWLLSTPYIHRRKMVSLLTASTKLPSQAQAIVLLGNNPPDLIFVWRHLPCFAMFDPQSRLESAATCYQLQKLPILLSGGITADLHESEARSMQRALETQFQIHTDWLEEASHTTAENAWYCAQILRQKGFTQILLATHPWHYPRAASHFRRLGFCVELCWHAKPAHLFPESGLQVCLPQLALFYLSYLYFREWVARLSSSVSAPGFTLSG